VIIGFAGGGLPEIRPSNMRVRNVSVIGCWWGGYSNFAPDSLTEALRTLIDWCGAGRIQPHIGTVLPFDHSLDGLNMLRERRAIGKIVIELGSSDI